MKKDEKIETEKRAKRPYRKPELIQVPLRPEEAVLGNCKISGIAGPAGASCQTYACSSIGS